MTEKQLPETGFLRLPEVLKYIPVGKSTWWAGVKEGRFPKPIKLGSRITAWRAEDIRLMIQRAGEEDSPQNHMTGRFARQEDRHARA